MEQLVGVRRRGQGTEQQDPGHAAQMGWMVVAAVTAFSVFAVSGLAQASGDDFKSGKEVYQSTCMECHGSGLLGSPKFKDKTAWAPLIEEGPSDLIPVALRGARKMPPRGGNPELHDQEVARAVVYMANAAGGKFEMPTQATIDAWVVADRAKLAEKMAAAGGHVPLTGQQVFDQVCSTCHKDGLIGAPRLGDKVAWKPLIEEGPSDLVPVAMRGARKMPPRGGRPDLTDIEVARGVVHMANAAGGSFPDPTPELVSEWIREDWKRLATKVADLQSQIDRDSEKSK